MIAVKRTPQSNVYTDTITTPVSSALIKEAELLMGAHRDFLTGVETMMTDWVRRQRAAFDVSSRSVGKICESRNIFDLLQAQNEWVSDCLEWTAAEIRAVGDDAAAMTQRAAQRLGEAVRERGNGRRQQGEPVARTAPAAALERAAAE